MMSKDYDILTAKHYAAYRPPLHQMILAKCLGATQQFDTGLDIGCGVGTSTIALQKYCEKVVGIDPSTEMLSKVIPAAGINYAHFDGQKIPFANDNFSIITFAGSWFYAKSQQLLDEVSRVAKAECQVVLYDFEILLSAILEKLGMGKTVSADVAYNHAENFTGLNLQLLEEKEIVQEQCHLEITVENLVHLILSEKANYHQAKKVFGAENVLEAVKNNLEKLFNSSTIELAANIYFSHYVLKNA